MDCSERHRSGADGARAGISRREFLKDGSMVVFTGAVGAHAAARGAPAGSKIRNHNPSMGYRRLGKTGLMISEVSLGGHGSLGLENRVQVLERAAELGLNYLDTNIVAECELYGKALKGKRDHWHIGFASWPEKLTVEAALTKQGMMENIEGRLKHYGTDRLDIWRPVGASAATDRTSLVTDRVLDLVVEVFEKAHRDGKLAFLGISAHNPVVFRRVLENYPAFSVILFPYLFLTKEFGGDSLLELARKKDVGVIAIKPFGAGTTFGIKRKEALSGKHVDPKAYAILKKVLAEPRITAVIPGVNIPEHLEVNVRASYEGKAPLTPGEKQALRMYEETFRAHLGPEYAWLREWEWV